MEELVSNAGRMDTLLREIATAAQEQHAGIGQISRSIRELDDATQHNAALVEEPPLPGRCATTPSSWPSGSIASASEVGTASEA